MKKPRLTITLDEEATAKWFEFASARTEGEVNADCEPSGSAMMIHLVPIFDNIVSVQKNGEWIDIGTADTKVIE